MIIFFILLPYDVVDPFTGRGTIIAIAYQCGLLALGIDIDEHQIKEAKKIIHKRIKI